MIRYTTIACLLIIGSIPLSAAELHLPLVHSLFTDHMVLQRDLPCPVWGWTTPDTQVTVTFADQQLTTTSADDGRWQVKLAPMPANANGQSMTITAATEPATDLTIKNVLIGDVWLCSGQSNMEFGIGSANQWWNELPRRTVDGIRLFWVQPKSAFTPLNTVTGDWSVASDKALLKLRSPYTSTSFSAIAWMFARTIHREVGVPVGIIESSVGNTAIQSWSTVESLWENDAKLPPNTTTLGAYDAQLQAWAEASDPAWSTSKTWLSNTFDDSQWASHTLPGSWQESPVPELKNFKGLVWMRRTVNLDTTQAGQPAILHLGSSRDQLAAWVNGSFVGGNDVTHKDLHTKKPLESHFALPPGLLVQGQNLIVIRYLGTKGMAGSGDLTPGLTLLDAKTHTITESLSLAGEWKAKASTATSDLTGRRSQYLRIWAPGGLYNGMISPLTPFALRGALWYQGEGNSGQRNYDQLLTRMISDWRKEFQVGDFPFYIVQLSNYGQPQAEPYNSSWALTRELQAKVARDVPNSGLAVSIDWGEKADIHPPNKRAVAERLAALALTNVYGKDTPCYGPTYAGMTIEDDKIRIRFDHATGLTSLGGGPAGLAIAGADKNFVWAHARIEGETLVVWSPEVPTPVAVRYAWANYSLCNLTNSDRLPAVPFRTDTW